MKNMNTMFKRDAATTHILLVWSHAVWTTELTIVITCSLGA